jgi:hypothetical protein
MFRDRLFNVGERLKGLDAGDHYSGHACRLQEIKSAGAIHVDQLVFWLDASY